MSLYTKQQDGDEVRRKAAGDYFRELRLRADLTQAALAKRLGVIPTFISGIENGKQRVPSDRLVEFAKALNINHITFSKRLLSYYDPGFFAALFVKQGQRNEEDS